MFISLQVFFYFFFEPLTLLGGYFSLFDLFFFYESLDFIVGGYQNISPSLNSGSLEKTIIFFSLS